MTLPFHQTTPNFTLPDLTGNPHTLSDYRGQIVILNFWSAECSWAARTDPLLTQYLATWGEAVTLLSIAANANEPPEMLRQTAAERNLPVVLHDAERTVTELYGAQTTPHVYVLDTAGRLAYEGAFDDVTFHQRTPTRSYLKDAVDALLSGQSPDPAQTPSYGCTLVYYPE